MQILPELIEAISEIRRELISPLIDGVPDIEEEQEEHQAITLPVEACESSDIDSPTFSSHETDFRVN